MPPMASLIGTVSAAAAAAPPESVIEYSPVIRPDRCAKSRLISDGRTTLQTPMAAPTRADPANSATGAGCSRIRIAATRSTRAPKTVRSIPNRAAHRGATGAASPKTSTGRVVSRPVTELLHPVDALISSTSGATDTTAGRRFAATIMMPIAATTAAVPTGFETASGSSDAVSAAGGLHVNSRHRRFQRCDPGAVHASQHCRRRPPTTNRHLRPARSGRWRCATRFHRWAP